MERLTLKQMRDRAIEAARAHGHELKWSSKNLMYTARCSKCGADLRAHPRAYDYLVRDEQEGASRFFARSGEIGATDYDTVQASGKALQERCRR